MIGHGDGNLFYRVLHSQTVMGGFLRVPVLQSWCSTWCRPDNTSTLSKTIRVRSKSCLALQILPVVDFFLIYYSSHRYYSAACTPPSLIELERRPAASYSPFPPHLPFLNSATEIIRNVARMGWSTLFHSRRSDPLISYYALCLTLTFKYFLSSFCNAQKAVNAPPP